MGREGRKREMGHGEREGGREREREKKKEREGGEEGDWQRF